MGLSHSSPSSPPNALAFHHKACGGARIISVTAVHSTLCKEFYYFVHFIKKKVVPPNNSLSAVSSLPQAAAAWQGQCPAAEGFGCFWGRRGLQQQTVRAAPCRAHCYVCQGVGVASALLRVGKMSNQE